MNLALSLRLMALTCIGTIALTSQAQALAILPTFGSSFGSAANPMAAEAAVNTAISAIDSLYSNAGSVPVLFEYNSGLNGGAQTNNVYNSSSYSSYYTSLQADLSANPGNTTLQTALNSLPSSLSQPMVTSVAFNYLVMGQSLNLCFDGTGTFISSCTGGTYAAVVTVSGSGSPYYSTTPGYNSTAVSAAEHELDEVLGGGGGGSWIGQAFTGFGPTDLYRYHSSGTGCTTATGLTTTRSFTTSTSEVACYSIDGGQTSIAQFEQNGVGDYGDFVQPVPSIQDAYVPGSPAQVYSSSSPEYVMMQSIGYNAVAAPEPSSLLLLAGATAGLIETRRRSGRRTATDRA